jgi:catechol 2,3-dioxygenase-like lactoylglutathione lyase family enzyme
MPAPSISGVDFLTIPTNDIEASKRFYGEVLGLPFVKQWGNLPGFEYQAGDLTLAIMDPTAFGQEFRPNSGMLAFAVDDVEAAREALKAEGVEFLNDMIDSGVCHQAIFRDPSGNVLDLHHRYAPGAPPQAQ